MLQFVFSLYLWAGWGHLPKAKPEVPRCLVLFFIGLWLFCDVHTRQKSPQSSCFTTVAPGKSTFIYCNCSSRDDHSLSDKQFFGWVLLMPLASWLMHDPPCRLPPVWHRLEKLWWCQRCGFSSLQNSRGARIDDWWAELEAISLLRILWNCM